MRHLALLRGINVGGWNRLPMEDLRGMFEAAGCTGVRTYIQSGNVIFDADAALATRVPDLIMEAVRGLFGYDIPVVMRTADELVGIVERNPFADPAADDRLLHVAFLVEEPGEERVAALDPDRSPPDAFAASGREVYLRLPNGMARTRLTNAYLDAVLGTVSTVRNWRTTLRLLEMAAGPR